MLDRLKGNTGGPARDDRDERGPTDSARDVIADNKRQVGQLRPYLRPQERLIAVFDMRGGGTGFLGITDKRLIIYDKAFFGKRKAMVSVPFSKVTRVASEDDAGGMFSSNMFKSSTLTVCVGSECYDFEFRGVEKAHEAYGLMIDAII